MQEQQEIQVLEQMQLSSRRPTARQSRGRAPAVVGVAGGGGGGGSNHLLDGSGNVLAVTVGVDQLTNA